MNGDDKSRVFRVGFNFLADFGDVRCDSVKRVASSVGEGSMCVQFVHEFLKELNLSDAS